MLAGFGLGAGALHELHAQDTPPAYVISEIDVLDENGYANEYIPLANKALAGSGQKTARIDWQHIGDSRRSAKITYRSFYF